MSDKPTNSTTANPPPLPQRGEAILSSTGLHKHYKMGDNDLHVLRGVALDVKQGEWVAIVGASGSGKSTLLHLLGGLDKPDKGEVHFQGKNVFAFGSKAVDEYRSKSVGFVFQFYHLLPELNAIDNVLTGAMVTHSVLKWPSVARQSHARAVELLTSLGLGERLTHRPSKLSGGERQRVAIARALINEPSVLLADEPTGNLDEKTGEQILDVFRDLHKQGQSIVMVTHDAKVANAADRRVTLERGRLK